MHTLQKALTICLASVVLATASPALAFALEAATAPPLTDVDDGDSGVLSNHWSYKVQRWEEIIAREANRRALDPDFLASLVWMESRGNSKAVGPVGAVGLTQVMPSEAGFSWRPSRAELMDPATNLFWGTRTLATVIQQGDGDVFNALAAYNGGWDQIQYRGPKHFATTILRDYAHAVAARRGLKSYEDWIAVFAVASPEIHGPIWIADSRRDDVYFYSDENWIPEGYPLIRRNVPPTAIVAELADEETGAPYAVGVWLLRTDDETWVTP